MLSQTEIYEVTDAVTTRTISRNYYSIRRIIASSYQSQLVLLHEKFYSHQNKLS